MTEISSIKSSFESIIKKIKSNNDLDQLQIKYLGRKGLVNNLLQSIDRLTQDERKDFGIKINELKTLIKHLIKVKRQELLKIENASDYIDITLPGYLDPGSYKVFVGMSNVIRTRSIYLGDIEIL